MTTEHAHDLANYLMWGTIITACIYSKADRLKHETFGFRLAFLLSSIAFWPAIVIFKIYKMLAGKLDNMEITPLGR